MRKMKFAILFILLIFTGCGTFSKDMNFEINKPIKITKADQTSSLATIN